MLKGGGAEREDHEEGSNAGERRNEQGRYIENRTLDRPKEEKQLSLNWSAYKGI